MTEEIKKLIIYTRKMKKREPLYRDYPEEFREEIRGYLKHINSVYVTYRGGFDIFFDTNELFQERSIVVRVGKNFVFEGFSLL